MREFRLALALTYRCNLRCEYCYVGPRSRDTMSVALASEALDLALARVGAGRLNLAFLGGEPLLAVERLEEIVSMASDRRWLPESGRE